MRTIPMIAIVVVLVSGASAAAQENPLLGSWKPNLNETDLKGETITITSVGPDELEVTAYGRTSRVKPDGKPRPTAAGYTEAWTKTGDNQWQAVVTLDGKPISTDAYRVSPDGKTLTITSRGKKVSGEPVEMAWTYKRSQPAAAPTGTSGAASDAPTLAGTWEGEDYSTQSPGTWEFAPAGTDGVKIRLTSWGSEATVKFDGKDYPMTGPMLPAGYTVSLKRTGPKTFEAAYKQNGKLLWTSSWNVSDDGRKLTMMDREPGKEKATKTVLERQQG